MPTIAPKPKVWSGARNITKTVRKCVDGLVERFHPNPFKYTAAVVMAIYEGLEWHFLEQSKHKLRDIKVLVGRGTLTEMEVFWSLTIPLPDGSPVHLPQHLEPWGYFQTAANRG